ncbi:NmrA family NAD(P)-binding protein [Streptomyces sp. MI02-7b]|uniref:NmrA family NAD(P)-binding protein n=1 Tax=Streptomyces sp. MI02-7b TaxID=462941 RepID=UPI0029AC0C39|nr:NmrA family NAD(P)-binding protein [Streptomyces sp. MI02-7b]MDX3074046.1 NmrA family NAD(P)-binding protein [Streptomyces sp. MI02-7b]
MIVITTPTGAIGRQVVDRVLDGGETVRVIVRDPSRLSAHVRAQAEVVQGSHGDAATITKALDGADRLFWLVPPAGFRDADNARRYYLEFTRSACQEAASRGVRVVGVTSLGRGYQGESGLLSAALAMDELIEASGVPYRALALPFFMENLLHQASAIRGQGAFSMANAADRPLPTIATRDAAAAAAALLLDTSWSGQVRVPLAGPDHLTPDAMAEVISETLGRTVRYRQVPLADFQGAMLRRGASPALAQDMADMVEAQNNGIYDAEPRDPGSATATGFRQWCQDNLKPAARS